MKRSKLLPVLLVVPALALAACTGAPAAAIQASQNLASSQTNNIASAALQSTAAPAASSSTTIQVPSSLTDLQSLYESIFQQVSPSVVLINVVDGTTTNTSSGNGNGSPFVNPFGSNPYASQTPTEALGSGFVWNTNGDIVTNNHVVSGATSITVTFKDGTTVPATVVGTDVNSDLAVIHVNVSASELKPVTIASPSALQVGEMVIAIGNPYGLDWSMSQGIVSGLARSLPTNLNSQSSSTGPTYNIPDIIQTDAAINPGNSGGVLVNLQGQVVGVTNAIESASGSSAGVGFAIPSEVFTKVIPSLISTGTFQHSYLGITGTDMTPAIASAMKLPSTTQGALVISVNSGGPAATAGLQGSSQQATINGQATPIGGDVITAINGQAVTSMDDLSSYLFMNTNPGQKVTLTILRNGKSTSVDVTTGVLPAQ